MTEGNEQWSLQRKLRQGGADTSLEMDEKIYLAAGVSCRHNRSFAREVSC